MDAYDHAMIAVAKARGTVTVRTQGPGGPAYMPATGGQTRTRDDHERRTATPKVRRHTRTAGYMKDDL